MRVKGLNHINLIASDIDATAKFYADVLGMDVSLTPNVPSQFVGRWIRDESGAPIIHVQAYNPDRHGLPRETGEKAGAIDHVALTCADMPAMIRHCEALGVPHRVNDGLFGLRQVFVTDPDNVVLELNFPEG